MQDVSDLYNEIIGGDHYFKTLLEVRSPNGKPYNAEVLGTYGETELFSITTNAAMFSDSPLVGQTIAGEIEIVMIKPSITFPTMAMLRPFVRVCNDTQQSEWIAQGVYYIDTREENKTVNGVETLRLHGYDAMLRAEQLWPTTSLNWPAGIPNIVAEIARIMGVDQDPRNESALLGLSGITLPMPVSYSLREVLGYIAQFAGGCWIMTETGKLRIVRLLDLPSDGNVVLTAIGGDVLTIGGYGILTEGTSS